MCFSMSHFVVVKCSAISASTPDRPPSLKFGHPPKIDSMDVSDDLKLKRNFFGASFSYGHVNFF